LLCNDRARPKTNTFFLHNYLAKAKNIQLANNPTTNSDIPATKPVTKKNMNYNLVCFIVNSGDLRLYE